jgi:hypothetical protein
LGLRDLVTFNYFFSFFILECALERFVAKVFGGGKVTIPVRVRELLGIGDGDYVRLEVLEVIRRGE